MIIEDKFDSGENSYGTLTLEVVDREGNIHKQVKQPVDSFTRWYWDAMWEAFIDAFEYSVTQVDGSSANIHYGRGLSSNAGVGSTFGIRFGTGSTAVALDDHQLDTEIVEGSSAGQFNYQGSNVTIDRSVPQIEISRSAQNNSGGSITVSEIGIYWNVISESYVYMGIRDVLGAPVDVPDGMSIVATYTINYPNLVNRNSFALLMFGIDNFWDFYRLDGGSGGEDSFQALAVMGPADAGESAERLSVGTDNTAPNNTEIDLQDRITSGNDAGQLSYGSTTANRSVDVANGTVEFTFTRDLFNNSGNDIDIGEVCYFSVDNLGNSIMIMRRALSSPVTIPDGTGRTVVWKLTYSL